MSRAAVFFRTCPLCEATCGLKLSVEADRVVRVEGDPDDVFSRGFICPKGAALDRLHDDPDRLRRPLIRDGQGHREASWAEAFAAVEQGLAPHLQGARDAIALYLGNPTIHDLTSSLYAKPLIKAFSTRNLYSASTVDQMPKHVSSGLLFGDPALIPVPDLDRTDVLLVLGANPMVSNGSLCTAPDFPGRLKALRQRGGTLIVVDPRRTETARRADQHLAIRPGADPYLLFAIVNRLFDRKRVDPGRLRPHLKGVDVVAEMAAPFTPSAVSAACGIDIADIEHLADRLADAERAVVYGRIGTTAVAFGTLTSWLVDVINVLTGNLDRPGGAMFARAAHSRIRRGPGGRGFRIGRWHSRVRQLPEVRSELPVATLADEILTPGPGQVRAMVTVAGNPVLSTPDAARMDTALASLDFMVSVDIYLNETTRHADVILPPPSVLERSHLDLAFYDLAVRNVVNYSPAVFGLADGAVDSAEIFLTLIQIAAGRGASGDIWQLDDFIIGTLIGKEIASEASPIAGRSMPEILAALGPRRGAERLADFLLRTGPYGDGFDPDSQGLTLSRLQDAPHGIDLGALEPRVPEILRTPSGRIELDSEPIAREVERLRRTLAERPGDEILLVGRRHLRSNNSWMHNVERLARGKDRVALHVHPDDAARLGLVGASLVRVRSRVGSLVAPWISTTDVRPGVVSLPHGWGHAQPGTRLSVAARYPGVNSNTLTDPEALDPLSGNAVLNGIPVQLEAAG